MKYLNIIIAIVIVSFFTSCSDETETIDFSGIYVGPLNCLGEVHEENGIIATFTISKVNGAEYVLDIGDEVIFNLIQRENTLTIPSQTANEGNGFDEVTMVGDITKTDRGIKAKFTVSVDDEGESTCDMELDKQ